jgi:uncharacterized membrane protein
MRPMTNSTPIPFSDTASEASISKPEIHSTAAIAGHPIHPSLIPLPVTMLLGALFTDLAFLQTRDRFWARNSRLLLLGGLITGLLAGLFGAIDYLTIPEVQRNSKARMHAAGNIFALVLTALNLSGRLNNSTEAVSKNVWLSGIVASILGVTAALGGELSYRDKIGVNSTPLHKYLDGSSVK